MFDPSKLIEARSKQGMNQTDFMYALEKAGMRVARNTIVNWEAGRSTPNVNNLAVIASVLRKPYSFFFTKNHSIAV